MWRQLQPVVSPSLCRCHGRDGGEGGLHLCQVYTERRTHEKMKRFFWRRSVCRQPVIGATSLDVSLILYPLPRPLSTPHPTVLSRLSNPFVTTVLSPLWLVVQNYNVELFFCIFTYIYYIYFFLPMNCLWLSKWKKKKTKHRMWSVLHGIPLHWRKESYNTMHPVQRVNQGLILSSLEPPCMLNQS